MSYKIEFPALVNTEKTRFIYDSSPYGTAPVASCFQYQQKRIDGESWNFPQTIPVEMVGEYFTSLAAILIENSELADSFRYKMASEPEISDIVFASKIVYKAGKKTKYFSRTFKRISAVKTKEYDKRWEEIREGMDGSPIAVLNFLLGEYPRDGLSRFIYARTIRKWVYSDRKRYTKNYMDSPAEIVGWTRDYHEDHAIEAAWEAVKLALSIHEQKRQFKSKQEQFMQHAMVSKLEN